MQLRETMGYTSQVANRRVDQEWGMRMLIKISKSPTKTHLRTISSQVHIRWLPLELPVETINCPNKYFSNPREISITTVSKYPWAPVTNQSMPTPNATYKISWSIQLMISVLNTKKLNQDQCQSSNHGLRNINMTTWSNHLNQRDNMLHMNIL